MIANWESSLAVRDGVFAQIFALTVLAVLLYRATPRFQLWFQVSGLVIFLCLFVTGLFNIILWTP
jgi:hypothetical protein